MPTEIIRLVDELVAQMRSRSGPGHRQTMGRLAEAARVGGAESATAVIEALAPWLRDLQGDYAATAVPAGACVEWGGSPSPGRRPATTGLGSHDAQCGGAGALGRGDPAETAAGAGEREQWPTGQDPRQADEPLLVLDPRTRMGYALTMGAIGDIFQLHTLLAERLIGDPEQGLVAGERRAHSWVEAATDGDSNLGTSDPAICRFRLFDRHGGHVYPDGVPADIEPLDGTRVLVLHPPNGTFGMGVGRVFEHMTPTLRLDRILQRTETQAWFDQMAPAVENDLTAG
ncbi:hypothetical protein [Streptomyces sp. NRRL S-646]|uniref:hypothetical protein n=1 Tax=Streptomyces sp. NRRL S-646 TaxID=1463917 RepID=UPI000B26221D|nr:hypothetical protein [Streptomyces sp. NRRL S-646]